MHSENDARQFDLSKSEGNNRNIHLIRLHKLFVNGKGLSFFSQNVVDLNLSLKYIKGCANKVAKIKALQKQVCGKDSVPME